jgi:hypothetical protein
MLKYPKEALMLNVCVKILEFLEVPIFEKARRHFSLKLEPIASHK